MRPRWDLPDNVPMTDDGCLARMRELFEELLAEQGPAVVAARRKREVTLTFWFDGDRREPHDLTLEVATQRRRSR